MSNSPNSHLARDFLSTPHLSLSLAGEEEEEEVREREERSGGGGGRREEKVEMSSENSGPGNDDIEMAEGVQQQNIEDEEDDDESKEKKRKYHRDTPSQIREMEALFKESPHPDEKQRLHLSKHLGLHPRQVKFWFQNRRTQIKVIHERHESYLLKTEIEKLRQETKALREADKKSSCPNCGFSNSSMDAMTATGEEQKLRIENAKLKAEVERFRIMMGKYHGGTSPSPNSSSHFLGK